MSDCIFCKIVNREIPTEFIYEDDKVVAFNDISPQAPVHILVIPKEHIPSLREVNDNNSHIIGHIHVVINKIAKDKGLSEEGFRVVNNCGDHGGQTVGHVHFHILGGRQMKWPPG